jgi:hypothetical protein
MVITFDYMGHLWLEIWMGQNGPAVSGVARCPGKTGFLREEGPCLLFGFGNE